jgi:hypothetical protein
MRLRINEVKREHLNTISKDREFFDSALEDLDSHMRIELIVGQKIRGIGVLAAVGPERHVVSTIAAKHDRPIADLHEGSPVLTSYRTQQRARQFPKLSIKGRRLIQYAGASGLHPTRNIRRRRCARGIAFLEPSSRFEQEALSCGLGTKMR